VNNVRKLGAHQFPVLFVSDIN